MKISFNKPILHLDGVSAKDEKGEPITLGKQLAIQLSQLTKGDAFKMFDWSKKMYNGETLNLDRSDTQLLKETIEKMENITVLFKAQLLEIFTANNPDSNAE